MDTSIILALVALGAAAALLAWFAIGNLRQGALLRRLARAGPGKEGKLEMQAGRAMALHGRVKVLAPLVVEGFGSCLWHRRRRQERRGLGKHAHWVTIDAELSVATLALLVGENEIDLGVPTEVQPKLSRSVDDRSGFLDFLTHRPTRTWDEWLPHAASLTVVGMLKAQGSGFVMEAAPSVGLLWTPRTPWAAAWRESLKGWSALALATSLVALGVWLVIRS